MGFRLSGLGEGLGSRAQEAGGWIRGRAGRGFRVEGLVRGFRVEVWCEGVRV